MRDAIRLSKKERQVAYRALSPLLANVALNRSQPDYALIPVLDAIVKAVNAVREGVPVGTIRRDLDTGEVWVCIHHGSDNWHGVAVTGYTIWADDEAVEDFPIIYTPEAL